MLGRKAERLALTPDAGIWEYRGRQRIHTHSVAMCWAGCNRLAAIAQRLGFVDRANHWNDVADRLHAAMMEKAWNEKRGAFTAAFGSDDLDASVLLLHELGVVEAEDPRFVSTVAAIERELLRDNHVMRYASPDDFGVPEGEFLICRFWLIDAWWALGRKQEARDLFVDALRYTQPLRAAGGAHPYADRTTLGQFPADLFDGGTDPDRDASVSKLGGSVLARLVVVSNRVSSPKSGTRAGGLEVAVMASLKRNPGIWFGWSGKLSTNILATRTIEGDPVSFVLTDLPKEDYDEYYYGFANRVLWPILHYRLDLAEFSRQDLSGYMQVNDHFADELHEMLQPDDVVWVHDYHFLLLAKALRERGHKNRIGFFLHTPFPPVEIITGLPHHERVISALVPLRSGGLPDRNRCHQFRPLFRKRVPLSRRPQKRLRHRRAHRADRQLPGRRRDRQFQQAGAPCDQVVVRRQACCRLFRAAP